MYQFPYGNPDFRVIVSPGDYYADRYGNPDFRVIVPPGDYYADRTSYLPELSKRIKR